MRKQVIRTKVIAAERSPGIVSACGHLGSCGKDLDNEDSFKLTVIQPCDIKEELMTSAGE